MDYDLLECPHCGGDAKLRVDTIKIAGRPEKAAWVYCKQCFAKTNYYRRALHPQDYIDIAVAAWNARIEDWWDDVEEENE